MNNNGKIKLELTPKEISILSNGLHCLILNACEAKNLSYNMEINELLDKVIIEYQRIDKKICDAVSGME